MYWVWKIVRWSIGIGMVMFVAKEPERAANIVVKIVNGIINIFMGFVNFAVMLFDRFAT